MNFTIPILTKDSGVVEEHKFEVNAGGKDVSLPCPRNSLKSHGKVRFVCESNLQWRPAKVGCGGDLEIDTPESANQKEGRRKKKAKRLGRGACPEGNIEVKIGGHLGKYVIDPARNGKQVKRKCRNGPFNKGSIQFKCKRGDWQILSHKCDDGGGQAVGGGGRKGHTSVVDDDDIPECKEKAIEVKNFAGIQGANVNISLQKSPIGIMAFPCPPGYEGHIEFVCDGKDWSQGDEGECRQGR